MGGGENFFSGSFRPGGPDIFQDALLKQPGILKDKGHLSHQFFSIHLPDVNSANGNTAAIRIPETGDQTGGGSLAPAGGSHKSRYLPRPDRKRHVSKSRPVRAWIRKSYMFKSYSSVCRALLHFRFFHWFLSEDLIETPHSLVRFHDSFAHIHDPVDHLTAGRSEQSVKNKVDKHRAHIPAGGHKQRRRDQQGKSPVNKGQKTGLSHAAAHGILAGQITVIFNSRIESLERIDRLLKHFYYGDTSDIFHRLPAHALDLFLISMEKTCVLTAHHQAHGKKRQRHGEQAQKPHFPVEKEQHHDSCDRRDCSSGQIGKLVSQQIFCKSGVIVNKFTQTSGLITCKESQGQFQHMRHGGIPDIPGRAESCDMGGHERRKIQSNTADGSPYRRPSPVCQSGGSAKIRPVFQNVSHRHPDAYIRDQPQHRGQSGKDTAQQGKIFVPACIA